MYIHLCIDQYTGMFLPNANLLPLFNITILNFQKCNILCLINIIIIITISIVHKAILSLILYPFLKESQLHRFFFCLAYQFLPNLQITLQPRELITFSPIYLRHTFLCPVPACTGSLLSYFSGLYFVCPYIAYTLSTEASHSHNI